MANSQLAQRLSIPQKTRDMKNKILVTGILVAALIAGSSTLTQAQEKNRSTKVKTSNGSAVRASAPKKAASEAPGPQKATAPEKGLTQEKVNRVEERSNGKAYSGKSENAAPQTKATPSIQQEKQANPHKISGATKSMPSKTPHKEASPKRRAN